MQPTLNDTIVALSTAPAWGLAFAGTGRALLRLSGPRAWETARGVFRPEPGEAGPGGADGCAGAAAARRVAWRRIPGCVLWRGRELPSCAYLMPAPRSYTRQDVVELHFPAVRAVAAETLDALRQAGARPAQPGEFTRRALLLGRISLSAAEAVGALVHATTADEARAWAARAAGHGQGGAAGLRADVEQLLAQLELGLDFSREDVELLPRAELGGRLTALARRARAAASGPPSEAGLLWSGEPRVVLAGPTNAGKSTLLNALLGRPAAIVSARCHTTRDKLEAAYEPAPGLLVRLADTAGLEMAGGPPGAWEEAQEAARRALRAADLLLLTLDRHAPFDLEALFSALDRSGPAHGPPVAAVVWTKADLPPAPDWPARAASAEAALGQRLGAKPPGFTVAALKGTGLAELAEFIAQHARTLRGRLAAAWAAQETAARGGAQAAAAALDRAETAFRSNLGEDALAVELREAVHALADAHGLLLRHDTLTETLLDRIFSRFCIGK
jgi:tRNA modification GTPase